MKMNSICKQNHMTKSGCSFEEKRLKTKDSRDKKECKHRLMVLHESKGKNNKSKCPKSKQNYIKVYLFITAAKKL